MAEAAGLAVGAVSLATLFSTCIECLDYVSRARNHGKDFKNAMTKFDMLEARLKAWGKLLLVDKPGNELQVLKNQWEHEQEIVGKALNRIKDIFDDRQELEKRYGLQEEEEEEEVNVVQQRSLSNVMASVRLKGIDARLRPYTRSRQQGVHYWKKTVWAVHDSKKFDTLIDDLDFYIRNLEKLTKRLRHILAQEMSVQANSADKKDESTMASMEEVLANFRTTTNLSIASTIRESHTHQNMEKSLNDPTLLHLQDDRGSNYAARANTGFCYAYSSLRPVAKYVSRPALESKVRNQLSTKIDCNGDESRTVVVCGLGGSGKSQIILNYVKQYRQEYEVVIWIEAGKKETIERDFIRLYRALFPDVVGSNNDTSITLDDAVTGVKGWFRQIKRRSLFVIDSADCIDNEEDPSYIDLGYFLPDALQVDIVITTRSSQAQALSLSEPVEVGQMTETEAVELLCYYAKIRRKDLNTTQEIIKIVEELGCLALAVTIAGSYIAATPRLASKIELYLPEYHKHRKRLLSRKAVPNIHSYKQSVLSTWEASFEAIKRQSTIAANLLCLLAFLNFDDIFMGLFPLEPCSEEWDEPREISHFEKTDGFKETSDCKGMSSSQDVFSFTGSSADEGILSPEKVFNVENSVAFQEMPTSEDISKVSGEEETSCQWQTLVSPHTKIDHYSIQEGFGMLQNYSLISWREDQEAYAMHKLVHTWGYDRLEVEERQKWSLAALHLLSETDRKCNEHTVPARLGRFLPHLVTNFTMMTPNFREPYSFKRGDLLRMIVLANLCEDTGKWDFTLHMRERIARFTDEVVGTEDPLALQVRSSFATILYYHGHFEQVEAISQQILRVQERSLSADHPDILKTKNDLISTLRSLNRLEEAKELASQALKTRERLFGGEHIITLSSKLNLAVVLSKAGQDEAAEDLYLEVLAVCNKIKGLDSHIILCKFYLAKLYSSNGRLEEAEDLLRQVVDADEQFYGGDHPNTLSAKSAIAAVMLATGRLEAADKYYSQVLLGRKKALGLKNPSTLKTMYYLALVFREQKKHHEALELAEECWRLRKEVFGTQHQKTGEAAELLEACRSSLKWKIC